MTSMQANRGFQELSPRGRLAALLDSACFTELAGPFDRIHSPWLLQQGLVPQSDDGVVVARGAVGGCEVVGIAIEGAFEGGSIGEVGGAKIAAALELAAESCRAGHPIAALLLLETGGVRLQEATLGLAAIAAIQSAVVELRDLAAVVAVIAGPVGCFGGMSLAAELCTWIVGTPHGRLGMNGPEVIEQEAGADEIDAGDRELIWQLVGCEARHRDGWIDAFVEDDLAALRAAVSAGIAKGALAPARTTRAEEQLERLRNEFEPAHGSDQVRAIVRARIWLERLAGGKVEQAFATASVLTANIVLPGSLESAFAIAIVPDTASRLPRAAYGELGIEQAWALAACIHRFLAEEELAGTQRPIVAIVDTPGQAFGRIEEQRCISAAAAAAVDAYARARRAGHPVLTLVVGRAVSGSFLAHGLQSDRIFALSGADVSMYAMSAQSIARITRRTLAAVQAAAAAALPTSFEIADAHRLGVIDTLIDGMNAEDPSPDDLDTVRSYFSEALATRGRGETMRASILNNPYRQATRQVRHAIRQQWLAAVDSGTVEGPGHAVEV
jgi:malonate decarboxylase beta subunit